jgi:DNA-binding CsgD family transcriptional regulator
LALPTLLYECETGAIREQDKSGITSAERKCFRRTAQSTWKDYKTNEHILSALKINPFVKKKQNYRNEWLETDCHTSL